MDRGTVTIQELPLVDFVNYWFDEHSIIDAPSLPLLQMLFRLEMTWYAGRALFSDTLLTCILCLRNPRMYAPSSKVSLIIESVMHVAALISQLSTAAPVNFEEDFHPNLYGMTWWLGRDEIEMELLLERLLSACREASGMERFYLARYYVRGICRTISHLS